MAAGPGWEDFPTSDVQSQFMILMYKKKKWNFVHEEVFM